MTLNSLKVRVEGLPLHLPPGEKFPELDKSIPVVLFNDVLDLVTGVVTIGLNAAGAAIGVAGAATGAAIGVAGAATGAAVGVAGAATGAAAGIAKAGLGALGSFF